MNDDIKTLWQNQTTEYDPMPLEEVRKRAGNFHSKIYWRNMREYFVSVVVIVWFGYFLWTDPTPLVRAGNAMMIAGTVYMMWQMHRRGAAGSLPVGVSASAWMDFYRRELVRQRDALRSIWKWYLAPFVPGIILILVGRAIQFQGKLTPVFVTAAICIAVFAGIWALNAWVARKLQRRIDELGG